MCYYGPVSSWFKGGYHSPSILCLAAHPAPDVVGFGIVLQVQSFIEKIRLGGNKVQY